MASLEAAGESHSEAPTPQRRDPGYPAGVAMILLAGLCLSSGGIAFRLIDSADVWAVSFFRSLGLTLVMLSFLLVRYGAGLPAAFAKIGWRGLSVSLFLGLGSVSYLLALSLTTVANTMFILASAPLLTAGLSRFFIGERVHKVTLIAMVIALAGIGVMAAQGLARGHLMGNLVAFSAALVFAAMLTIMRSGRDIDLVPASALGGVIAALLSLPLAGSLVLSGQDLSLAIYLGIGQVGVGFLLITLGTRRVPAAEVSLLALSEVILAPIWVWIFINEVPSPLTLLGGSIVLLAVIGQALWRLLHRA